MSNPDYPYTNEDYYVVTGSDPKVPGEVCVDLWTKESYCGKDPVSIIKRFGRERFFGRVIQWSGGAVEVFGGIGVALGVFSNCRELFTAKTLMTHFVPLGSCVDSLFYNNNNYLYVSSAMLMFGLLQYSVGRGIVHDTSEKIRMIRRELHLPEVD